MGCRHILATGRLKFFLSNAVYATAAYGLAHPARYPDLFTGHRLSLLGNEIECGLHTEMFQHKDISELKQDFQSDVSLLDK